MNGGFKGFIVNNECDAQMKVFITREYMAQCPMYIVHSEWEADVKVFIVNSEWQADTCVYLVNSEIYL